MKKNFCRDCVHKCFEDGNGIAWCNVFEIDVETDDEACVEFEEGENEDEY